MNTPYELIANAILNNAGADRALAALETAGYVVVKLPTTSHANYVREAGPGFGADELEEMAGELLLQARNMRAVDTTHLLSSPANAERLHRSLEDTAQGDYTEHALIDTEETQQ